VYIILNLSYSKNISCGYTMETVMNMYTKMIAEVVGCDTDRALRIQDYMESDMDIDFSESSERALKRLIKLAAEAVQ